MQTNNNSTQYRVRINGYIRVPQIRVILEDGTSPGIVNTFEALKWAKRSKRKWALDISLLKDYGINVEKIEENKKA